MTMSTTICKIAHKEKIQWSIFMQHIIYTKIPTKTVSLVMHFKLVCSCTHVIKTFNLKSLTEQGQCLAGSLPYWHNCQSGPAWKKNYLTVHKKKNTVKIASQAYNTWHLK